MRNHNALYGQCHYCLINSNPFHRNDLWVIEQIAILQFSIRRIGMCFNLVNATHSTEHYFCRSYGSNMVLVFFISIYRPKRDERIIEKSVTKMTLP